MTTPNPNDKGPETPTTNDHSDVDTLSTSNGYERGREDIRNANPQGLSRTQSGVDVEKAEQDFAELNRQLSGISHQARSLSRQVSRASKGRVTTEDVEKTGSSTESEEPWDLQTALHGSRAAENDAGIRPKRISWFAKNITSVYSYSNYMQV